MKTITTIAFLCFSLLTFAQVGVGNTDPKASLDISASNTTTPTNEDGILIPRIDNFPTTNPGADQDGMMVFYTGTALSGKGFYYWDNGTGNWVAVQSSEDADWYEVGSTSSPNNINLDKFTYGKLGIGTFAIGNNKVRLTDGDATNYSGLSVERILNANNPSSVSSSIRSIISVTGNPTDLYFGIGSEFVGTYSGQTYNFSATSPSTANNNNIQYRSLYSLTGGTGDLYGFSSSFVSSNVSNTGDKYGFYVDIPLTLSGTHYGLYSNVQNSSSYAAYLLGRTSLGETSNNRYLMPANDGTNGQVMTTDGAGNITFQTISTGNDWSLNGNSGTNASTNFLGTTDNVALTFRTNNVEKLRLTTRGQIVPLNSGNSIYIGANTGNLDNFNNINNNIGIGTQALQNATGINNIAIGRTNLMNSTGGGNIAIGTAALSTNTTGASNTAIGRSTLSNNTTGNGNTAIGHNVLNDNTIGLANTALGYYALLNNTEGGYNTALGHGTLSNITTSSYNVAVGQSASEFLSIGNYNTALGRGAGDSDNNSSFNVYLGARAGGGGANNLSEANESKSGNIFIGYSAGYNENNSNRLYIENSDSTTPLIYGEFDNDILRTNGEFQIGNPTGTGYAFPTADGINGQALTTDGAGNLAFTTINTSITEGNDTDVVSNQVDLEPILDVVHTINSPNDIFELSIPFNSNPNKVLFSTSSTGIPFFSVSPDISSNIGIGINNGSENTDAGFYNIFMGYNSGRNTTSTTGISSEGSNNIAFGQQSLYVNTIGNENIAIGSHALRDVDTGDENVAVGSYALTNVLGSRNVAIGNNAGFNETGSDKLYIENSMADADNALIYGEFGTDNTTSGNILRTNSQFQIGNPSVTGYAFPTTDGTIGQVLTTDGAGTANWTTLTSSLATASNGLTEVSNDVQLGGALSQNTTIDFANNNLNYNLDSTGDFNIQDNGTTIFTVNDIGETTFGNDTYWRDGSIGGGILGSFYDTGSNGTLDIYGSGTVQTRLRGSGVSYINNGQLAIGDTNSSGYRLHVVNTSTNYMVNFLQTNTLNASRPNILSLRYSGNISDSNSNYIGFFRNTTQLRGRINPSITGVQYSTTSDRRLKQNITEVANALEIIKKIKPTTYQFKDIPTVTEYGFIAQDLQKIYPQAVSGSPDSDPTKNPMMVDYGRLTPILTAGIKELHKEVIKLKTENEILKNKLDRLAQLEARLSVLEKKSN